MNDPATVARPFQALGLAGHGTDQAYVVLEDGTAHLLALPAATLTPVPDELQAAIRLAHPDLELSFPQPAAASGGAPRSPRSDVDGGACPGPDDAIPVAASIDEAGSEPAVCIDPGGFLLALPLANEPPVRPDGDWDAGAVALEHLLLYEALEAKLRHGRAWKTTRWHADAITQLRACERPLPDVATVEALHARLREWDRLHAGLVGGDERALELAGDAIELGFDRAGRPVVLRGHAELIAARLAGLRALRVRVGARHPEWEDVKEAMRDYGRRRKRRIYQRIDHPDLATFPFHHGTDRVHMIYEALAGFPAQGARLLDIGAHWGYMSQQMEKLGFDVTAVESNKQCARFARLLAQASGAHFEVWRGRIFDFPEAEQQRAVLALNIFHHLIKTEELHAGLIAFLGRLRAAEVIIFEPHVPDPPAQMEGAYRNYGEQEFAHFVAEHAGLASVDFFGRASDGRPLFRLAR